MLDALLYVGSSVVGLLIRSIPMRAQLLFQLFATALANKFMPTITLPKFGRAQPARINQPSKNDKYSVTKNTTRVVVLKVPHSGSTWFAALLNRFPRSYVKEESITKTRSNNVDPSAIHEHVGTSLIRPTDKMVASSAQIKFRGASHAIDATPARRRGGSGSSLLDEHLTHWLICAQVASRNGKHAFSPRAKNFDCGGCELALLGLTMCPMRSEPPYDFPQGVTAAIFHQTIKFKTIFWARTNVVKMSFAS